MLKPVVPVKQVRLARAYSPSNHSQAGVAYTLTAAKREFNAKRRKYKKEVERFSAAFVTAVKHGMLLAGLPGHQFGIVTAVVLWAIGSTGGGSGDATDADALWLKLEGLVKNQIGQELSGYHLSQTRYDLNLMIKHRYWT